VTGQESLWSPTEVKIQAAQTTGQTDIWEALSGPCEACGSPSGEPCDPFCVGVAAHADVWVQTYCEACGIFGNPQLATDVMSLPCPCGATAVVMPS